MTLFYNLIFAAKIYSKILQINLINTIFEVSYTIEIFKIDTAKYINFL